MKVVGVVATPGKVGVAATPGAIGISITAPTPLPTRTGKHSTLHVWITHSSQLACKVYTDDYLFLITSFLLRHCSIVHPPHASKFERAWPTYD